MTNKIPVLSIIFKVTFIWVLINIARINIKAVNTKNTIAIRLNSFMAIPIARNIMVPIARTNPNFKNGDRIISAGIWNIFNISHNSIMKIVAARESAARTADALLIQNEKRSFFPKI